ncbi:MAG: glycosyl hydrolase family 18 protein [Patescibacteria group bacterium]
MKTFFHRLGVVLAVLAGLSLVIASFAPMFASAAHAQTTDLEYSGWIPYWAAKKGADDARKHIKQLDEVNPFTYTVKSDGSINDAGKMSASHWRKLKNAAEKEDVRYVPTIMWSDGAKIHATLSNSTLRAQHIKEIVELVEDHDYDGIDIDYEGKLAETKDYFSLFLAELALALDDKWLSCSIEARMPVADRYTGTPPATAYQVANDLPAIGKACDRVRVMTYDQQTADQKLNALRAGAPYFPVADSLWTEKVINLMDNDISKDKLAIGVATYGRELEVTVSPTGKYTYKNLWSFNPGYATEIEKKNKVKRSRNVGGEMSLTYIDKKAKNGPSQKELIKLAPSGTPSGEIVAAGARAYAAKNNTPVTFRFLSWSDAGALKGHVDLAKRLGVRGIAVFKIDGSEDKGIWAAMR